MAGQQHNAGVKQRLAFAPELPRRPRPCSGAPPRSGRPTGKRGAGLLCRALAGSDGEQERRREVPVGEGPPAGPVLFTRRGVVAGGTSLLAALSLASASPGPAMAQGIRAVEASVPVPDYSVPGPYSVKRLPRLEHTCTNCFPMCVDNKCLVRVDVTYPGGASSVQGATGAPYPLVIFSSGFLVGSEQYRSYAERMASWGYVCMVYDKVETISEPLNDDLCARIVGDLIDWAGTDVSLKQLCSNESVLLCGHSRGGKVSVLAAVKDPRVRALCLIDPVDNTVYAPLGPGYPSAVAALRASPGPGFAPPPSVPGLGLGGGSAGGGGAKGGGGGGLQAMDGEWGKRGDRTEPLQVAVVGSKLGGDCAPADANYRRFFDAARDAAWEVEIQDAGHFQFLDNETIMQTAVCARGAAPNSAIKEVAMAVMVTWAEAFVQRRYGEVRPGRKDEPASRRGAEGAGGGGWAIEGMTLVELCARAESAGAYSMRKGGWARAKQGTGEGLGGDVLLSRVKFGPVKSDRNGGSVLYHL